MKGVLLLVLFSFLYTGCTTTGSVSNLHEKSMEIGPGVTKDKVVEILGMPGDRSFRGAAEAWQYCSTGFSQDKYITVWLYEDIVEGLTTYTRSDALGTCTQTFSSVDWGQAPNNLKVKLTIQDD
jgi:hypothetical protein